RGTGLRHRYVGVVGDSVLRDDGSQVADDGAAAHRGDVDGLAVEAGELAAIVGFGFEGFDFVEGNFGDLVGLSAGAASGDALELLGAEEDPVGFDGDSSAGTGFMAELVEKLCD